jgi:hypothetical protein
MSPPYPSPLVLSDKNPTDAAQATVKLESSCHKTHGCMRSKCDVKSGC